MERNLTIGKKLKSAIVGVLSLAIAVSATAVSAFAADAGQIEVTIGDGEASVYTTFADAIAAVRAADDDTAKVITLGAGEFKAADANTFRIDEPNVTIEGAGADQTTINTESYAVSGQAGILISADNVTIRNLKVTSTNPGNSGSAIKVSKIGDGTSLPDVNNVAVSDVVITTEIGFGLNLHGVDNAVITNVTVENAAKASVNVANATNVAFTGLQTGTSGWGVDIQFSYSSDNVNYNKASNVTVTDSTLANNVIVTERPASAEGGTDSVTVDDENLTQVANSDGSYALVASDSDAAASAITNENTGAAYSTIQAAVDDASENDTILIPAGEYTENIVTTVNVTIKGAGKELTTIKFDKTTRQGVEYFADRIAYPTVYAQANLTMQDLTIAGPTDEHYGIDGILAKADLTLTNVKIADMRCTADGGFVCGVQYDRPVMVDGSGNVTIENCEFVDFQKQAIDLNTTGTIVISNNTITGLDDNGIIAQNGIVLRNSGEATITGNTISLLRYTADNEWTDCSYAVLLMGDASATITENTIEDIDNGISVEETASASIENNIIDADHAGLYVNTTGDVDAPNNYWGGDVSEKVQGETAADVTGLDDVKDEPVIDEPTEPENPSQPSDSSSDSSSSSSETSEPSVSSDASSSASSTASGSNSTTSNPETSGSIAAPISIGALLAVSGAAAIFTIRRKKSA